MTTANTSADAAATTTPTPTRSAVEVAELVDQFTPLTLALVGKFAKGRTWLRDDLASDAAFALFKAARTWQPERESAFITWATIHIRGALIQRIERERKRLTIAPQASTITGDDGEPLLLIDIAADHRHPPPDAAIDLRDDLAALPGMLEVLPAHRQELLWRYIAEDETSTTIAAEQGVTPQAIRDRVSRDLSKLRAAAGE